MVPWAITSMGVIPLWGCGGKALDFLEHVLGSPTVKDLKPKRSSNKLNRPEEGVGLSSSKRGFGLDFQFEEKAEPGRRDFRSNRSPQSAILQPIWLTR